MCDWRRTSSAAEAWRPGSARPDLGSAAAGSAVGGCPDDEGGELGAVGDVELGEYVGEVGFHGGAGDEQAVGDARVGQALGDELCPLPFGGVRVSQPWPGRCRWPRLRRA